MEEDTQALLGGAKEQGLTRQLGGGAEIVDISPWRRSSTVL